MREGEKSMIAPKQPETCNHPTYARIFTGDRDVFSLLVLFRRIHWAHRNLKVCKTIKYNASFVLDVQLKLNLAETYTQVFKFDLGNSHCSNH